MRWSFWGCLWWEGFVVVCSGDSGMVSVVVVGWWWSGCISSWRGRDRGGFCWGRINCVQYSASASTVQCTTSTVAKNPFFIFISMDRGWSTGGFLKSRAMIGLIPVFACKFS